MKKIFKYVLAVIIILTLSLGIFIFWGSSSPISDKDFFNGRIFKRGGIEKKEGKTWTVMTYNAGFASGMANSMPYQPSRKFYDKNLNTIIQMIHAHNPDFLAIQEIDFSAKRSFYRNQVFYIQKILTYVSAAYAPNFAKRYVPFPYWPPSAHWGRINSGQATFARTHIKEQKIVQLEPPESFSPLYKAFYIERLIQKCEYVINGKKFFIFNVHLEAWDRSTREKQARTLIKHYNKVKKYPVIIAGDFNVMPSYATKKHNIPGDEYKGDYRGEKTIDIILREKSLNTAISKKRYLKNEQKYMTYSSKVPHMRIDFIFYNNYIENLDAYVVRKNVQGSDHRPVFMKFRLKK
jgi:endonuclease/exonuclease/phosphatase family metal-dependent hydrolase